MTPPGFLMVTMRTTPSMTTTVFVNPRLRPTGALMDTSVWVSATIHGRHPYTLLINNTQVSEQLYAMLRDPCKWKLKQVHGIVGQVVA